MSGSESWFPLSSLLTQLAFIYCPRTFSCRRWVGLIHQSTGSACAWTAFRRTAFQEPEARRALPSPQSGARSAGAARENSAGGGGAVTGGPPDRLTVMSSARLTYWPRRWRQASRTNLPHPSEPSRRIHYRPHTRDQLRRIGLVFLEGSAHLLDELGSLLDAYKHPLLLILAYDE